MYCRWMTPQLQTMVLWFVFLKLEKRNVAQYSLPY
jgi:hypothetical protein